jgi:transposase
MRTRHERWSQRHMQAMPALQRTHLKTARAWRMKTALRQAYEAAAQAQSPEVAKTGAQAIDLVGQALATGAVQALGQNAVEPLGWRGRGNVAVPNQCLCGGHEWLASAGQAGGGGKNTENFIAIAYLRISKLAHLPTSPFESVKPRIQGRIMRCV